MFDTEILEGVLSEEEYSIQKTPSVLSIERVYEDVERKFKECLPENLRKAFDDLMDIRLALECEHEEIAKAAGIRIAGDLHRILLMPLSIMEKGKLKHAAPFQVYAKEIANITRIYENMSHTEVEQNEYINQA